MTMYVVREDIIKELGAESAVFYAVIENIYYTEKAMNNLIDKRWVKISVKDIKQKLNFSDYQQRKIIEILVKNKLIDCKVMGLPATRYFTLEV